jgi:hypothetical protein
MYSPGLLFLNGNFQTRLIIKTRLIFETRLLFEAGV